MADDFKAVDLTKVYDDTISTRPFDLTDDSEHQAPKYVSGEELSNMTRIDSSWKNPQFKIPSALDANNIRGADLTKPEEFAATFVRAATDKVENIPDNLKNLVGQTVLEAHGDTINRLAQIAIESKDENKFLKNTEVKDLVNEIVSDPNVFNREYDPMIVDALDGREYPVVQWARNTIANATNAVKDREIAAILNKEQRGIDQNAWSNKFAEILGDMTPILAVGAGAGSIASALGASGATAGAVATGATQAATFVDMSGQYAYDTAREYLDKTGDSEFRNFTAKDAKGLSALGYGAIGTMIEFGFGGVEPLIGQAFTKAGVEQGIMRAVGKVAVGEAWEEFLQEWEEFLFRKIDGTNNRTYGQALKDSLQAALWGGLTGGALGGVVYRTNRRNIANILTQTGLDYKDALKVADTALSDLQNNIQENAETALSIKNKTGEPYNRLRVAVDDALKVVEGQGRRVVREEEREEFIDGIVDNWGTFALNQANMLNMTIDDFLSDIQPRFENGEIRMYQPGYMSPQYTYERLQDIEKRISDIEQGIANEAEQEKYNEYKRIANQLRKINAARVARERTAARKAQQQAAKVIENTPKTAVAEVAITETPAIPQTQTAPMPQYSDTEILGAFGKALANGDIVLSNWENVRWSSLNSAGGTSQVGKRKTPATESEKAKFARRMLDKYTPDWAKPESERAPKESKQPIQDAKKIEKGAYDITKFYNSLTDKQKAQYQMGETADPALQERFENALLPWIINDEKLFNQLVVQGDPRGERVIAGLRPIAQQFVEFNLTAPTEYRIDDSFRIALGNYITLYTNPNISEFYRSNDMIGQGGFDSNALLYAMRETNTPSGISDFLQAYIDGVVRNQQDTEYGKQARSEILAETIDKSFQSKKGTDQYNSLFTQLQRGAVEPPAPLEERKTLIDYSLPYFSGEITTYFKNGNIKPQVMKKIYALFTEEQLNHIPDNDWYNIPVREILDRSFGKEHKNLALHISIESDLIVESAKRAEIDPLQFYNAIQITRGLEPTSAPAQQIMPFEQFDLADENARLDDIYPAYDGETIVVDGVERTVYNSEGKRINKSAEALTNFWRWFGDSKVVDEQGRPLVVYHGARGKTDITEFRPKEYGYNVEATYFATNSNAAGHWAQSYVAKRNIDENFMKRVDETNSLEELLDIYNSFGRTVKIVDYDGFYRLDEEYQSGATTSSPLGKKITDTTFNMNGKTIDVMEMLRRQIKRIAEQSQVSDLYSVYAKLENPLIVDAKKQPYHSIEFNGEKTTTATIAQFALDNNYDGLIIKNVYETDYENVLTDDVLAFEPTQIKSVDNRGTYDLQDPNIYYDRSPSQWRGMFNMIRGAIAISGSVKPSTIQHELAHFWLDNMWNRYKSGKYTDAWLSNFQSIAKWLGLNLDADYISTPAHEQFARGYEAFISGRTIADVPGLKPAFDRYDRFVRRVYKTARDIRYRDAIGHPTNPVFTKEAFDAFDRLLQVPDGVEVATNAELIPQTKEEKDENAKTIKKSIQETRTKIAEAQDQRAKENPSDVPILRTTGYAKDTDGKVKKSKNGYYIVSTQEGQEKKALDLIKSNPQLAESIIWGGANQTDIDRGVLARAYANFIKDTDPAKAELIREYEITTISRSAAKTLSHIPRNDLYRSAARQILAQKTRNLAQANYGLRAGMVEQLEKDLENRIALAWEAVKNAPMAQKQAVAVQQIREIASDFSTVDELPETLADADFTQVNERTFTEIAGAQIRRMLGLTLTQNESDQLDVLVEQIENSMQGESWERQHYLTEETARLLRQYSEFIAGYSPQTMWDKATKLYYPASMLMNFPTHFKNVITNLFQQVASSLSVVGGIAQIEIPLEQLTKDAKYDFNLYLKTGFMPSVMTDITSPQQILGEKRMVLANPNWFDSIAEKSLNVLSVEDAVFKSISFYRELAIIASKQAKKEGLTGKALKARALELYREGRALRGQTEWGIETRAQASEIAKVDTFVGTNGWTRLARSTRNTLNQITIRGRSANIGNILSPFIVVGTNIVRGGFNLTGLPIASGIAIDIFHPQTRINDTKVSELIDLDILSERQAKALFKGGKINQRVARTLVAEGQITEEELKGLTYTERFGGATVRGLSETGFAWLFILGLMSVLDDDDWMPDYDEATAAEKARAKEQGIQFGSIRFGNTWVSTDLFGYLKYPIHWAMNTRRFGVKSLPQSALNTAAELPVISDVMDLWNRNKYNKTTSDYLRTFGNTIIDKLNGFIPGVVNNAKRILQKSGKLPTLKLKKKGETLETKQTREFDTEDIILYTLFGQAISTED